MGASSPKGQGSARPGLARVTVYRRRENRNGRQHCNGRDPPPHATDYGAQLETKPLRGAANCRSTLPRRLMICAPRAKELPTRCFESGAHTIASPSYVFGSLVTFSVFAS